MSDDENDSNGRHGTSDQEEELGLVEVRDRVRSDAAELIGHPFDALIAVRRLDDEPNAWRAVVEVVERKAVPDTQDILGRYALTLNAQGAVVGYRRFERIRRDDTSQKEYS